MTLEELRAEVVTQGRLVIALDREVAVIKTEMTGIHKEIREIKDDVRAAAKCSSDTRDKVNSIENQARGAWRIMVSLQVLVSVLLGAVAFFG